jgi:hypothetical protein
VATTNSAGGSWTSTPVTAANTPSTGTPYWVCSVPTGNTFSYAATPAAVARIPTDGARLTVCGRDFGLAPAVVVALDYATALCPSARGACCVNVTASPGEGYGYNWRLSSQAAAGFRVLVSHNGQAGSVAVAYELATVSRVVSADGTFPTAGGVTVWVLGANFGAPLFCNTSNVLFLPCPDVVQPVVQVGRASVPPQRPGRL